MRVLLRDTADEDNFYINKMVTVCDQNSLSSFLALLSDEGYSYSLKKIMPVHPEYWGLIHSKVDGY